MKYTKINVNNKIWVITDKDRNYLKPNKALYTFAFDTETITYLDGKQVDNKTLYRELKDVETSEKRKRVTSYTWAYQCYDEINGFFMTNDFITYLEYVSRCGLKFGWCYNATFDFSQIDYQVLAVGKDLWKPHEHFSKVMNNEYKELKKQKEHISVCELAEKTTNSYNKHQPYTYESLHNNTGCRYAYKLWIPYKDNKNRNVVHSIELRDFMKLCGGGLRRVLNDLDVKDNEGKPVRKLEMEYQAVDVDNLTDEEIDYCKNDVKGLYFAVKKFNETIKEQSNNESTIFGKDTNVMTSGGFAKKELLRSLYPNVRPHGRLKFFQHDHKITVDQDKYLRNTYLYRGGITYLNPRFKGKLITDKIMYRYDVNSEYPYAMSIIRDLVGKPFRISINEWFKFPKSKKEQYECIYICKGITGSVKPNMLGVWYNPFTKEFEDNIYEEQEHLIYEREILEMYNWYDLEIDVDEVILLKRGGYAYRPFIEDSYKVKAQAKKDKNKTLQAVTKLKLNSSYGKLSERVERTKGHYELNDLTGAIHFVEDGEEVSEKSIMNVFIGALITSTARVYILSKCREITENKPLQTFIYMDTDSIHTIAKPYDKADAFKLGALKLEAQVKACKYIMPKTYVDVMNINQDGSIKPEDIEIHSKGVSVISVMTELKKKKKITLKDIDEAVAYGKKYTILCAMNVKGGKVLLPTDKYIAKWEHEDGDDLTCKMGASSLYLTER